MLCCGCWCVDVVHGTDEDDIWMADGETQHVASPVPTHLSAKHHQGFPCSCCTVLILSTVLNGKMLQSLDSSSFLQRFDPVGWATGRASGLWKVGFGFVGCDDLTDLQLQLSPPSLASIKQASPGSPGKTTDKAENEGVLALNCCLCGRKGTRCHLSAVMLLVVICLERVHVFQICDSGGGLYTLSWNM